MATEVWVDSKVIVRFLTGDPPDMAQRALRLMERAESGRVVLKLSTIIVAECCWVLESVYEYEPPAIAKALSDLIQADGVEAEEEEVLLESLEIYKTKGVDFIDAYLAMHARSVGPDRICTFDRKHFQRLGVTHLTPEEVNRAAENDRPREGLLPEEEGSPAESNGR